MWYNIEMEVNLNCDLGEKSEHYSGINDQALIEIINTANIACGYHAGSESVIETTIKIAKENNVSIGAHPGFADKKNFGRKRIELKKNELKKLIRDQLEIISGIADAHQWPITHVKPHGALNNMACENFDVGLAIGESVYEFNKDLIYLVLPLSEMEKAAQQLNLKYACEIFADRNYQDNGQLISRTDPNAMIESFKTASENILEMLHTSSIKCLSGKKIKCQIDSICIHGDGLRAVSIAKELKKVLIENNIQLVNLDKLN
ncbi:MAG: hypothetical protein CFH12_00209 [Alphaproteobacteria bacterium MarineAlpha5_Bin2]|jgi:UPF0271 protein|nr:LamB/YcsF family protein [Alphaproteobacteria bacterium]PPR55424.1 MAG: hypothetical protein CFH12_00209 [Alphaproteobacteria bacterium MarineAlpha5_Bin2]PPR56064.1 MAG: hypothetical protein CFH13_00843 [Alphaproteobacteria bacterium MarineAlpha5_Bin3]HIC42716.1 LamB/YcsF family protein [Pelagibacterales bacterium]